MSKSLVLHIGDPKTGSSSIQQALFERKFECDQVSLDYPPKLNAIHLANSIRRPALAGEVEGRFRAASAWLDASQSDVAVLSAEQFSSIDPDEVNTVFAKYMPDHAGTMRVVAYARPHVSRFLSAYAQRVKVGGLQAEVEGFFQDNVNKRFLNFFKRFRKWRDVYGDRFVLRPMVRDLLRDGDVVADFIGIAVQDAPFRVLDQTSANTTLPVEALSGLKYLQSHLAERKLSGGDLHGVGSHINRLCGQLPSAKGTKLRLGRDLYDRICEISRGDAVKLDAEFFGGSVMVKAMDEAAADTVDKTTSTDAALYFPAQDLAKLTAQADALAHLLSAMPQVWKESLARQIGQRPDGADEEDVTEEVTSHIARVNAILAETASLISMV